MKKYSGEILLVLGAGIFFYNILAISHYSQITVRNYVNTWYGYTTAHLLGIAVGVMFGVAAFLIIRNKSIK